MSQKAEAPTDGVERAKALGGRDTLREPVSDVRGIAPTRTPSEPELEGPLAALRRAAERRVGALLAGRYDLETLIGTGSAGAVFAAFDRNFERRVAIKVLHEGLRTSDEAAARFRREARATASIGHGGVATVLDVGRDERGCLYMAMELLDGTSFFTCIVERLLTDEESVEIALQLLDVLGAAHGCGIVHRDVKPENVFVARDAGGSVRVKLLDFGIAKYLEFDGRSSFRTLDGMLVGTPHYMSPEMCRGEPIDERADLWATAAVLFHALAGEPPFDDDQVGRLLMKIVSGRAPSLAKRRPDLPAHVADAVDRALRREPSERFPSAAELARALAGA